MLKSAAYHDIFFHGRIGTMKEVGGGLHACAGTDVEPIWSIFFELGAKANVRTEDDNEVEHFWHVGGCLPRCAGVLVRAGAVAS